MSSVRPHRLGAMENRSASVDAYMAELQHARRDDVQRLRLALLTAEPGLEESIKWNAPSFRFAGEDRVTFRLRPGDRLQLVLHRGAKVRDDAAGFRFADPTGRLRWPAPDRAVLSGEDAVRPEDVAEITALVKRWVRS